ncbi:hypothetical protein QTP81_09865 [Alteromonas sp. ASW11-36]|uniref:PEP-CTERM sorting domain-containing protein n=1 Tax=Alteromonas arenosi TaxID=3055817 RepID=A0ABT7SXI7_9ALTE|nr:hypothetical protein [Alteromonas sp. ASW11-36]MDM7860901.1 hypothetical protein [Alteromonas sp. ASW11-36]
MSAIQKRFTSLIGAVCLCISMTLPTQATIITNGCAGVSSCTLDELFAGGSIGIDDVTFGNWFSIFNETYQEDFNTDSVTTGTINTSGITVAGIDSAATGNANEFTLGLMFSAASALQILDIVGDFLSTMELDFGYNASAVNATTITAASLTLGNRFVEDFDSLVEVSLASSVFTNNLETFERFFEFDQPQKSINNSDSESFAGVSVLDLATIIDLEVDSYDEPGHLLLQDVTLDSFTVMLTVQTSSTPPPPRPVNAPATLGLFIAVMGLVLMRGRKTRH